MVCAGDGMVEGGTRGEDGDEDESVGSGAGGRTGDEKTWGEAEPARYV